MYFLNSFNSKLYSDRGYCEEAQFQNLEYMVPGYASAMTDGI